MSNRQWMENATRAAETVYVSFMDQVVIRHVIRDREKVPLGEATRKKVEGGSYIDPRAIRLMTISGKGGYSDDPLKQAHYESFYNVTLLDHLLSVTRGALVLAALDWLQLNPKMDSTLLHRRLSLIAVVAFMHDIDKDMELPRNTPLETEDVEERITRYGIADFLSSMGISLSASQVRYLIQKVESSQAHREPPDSPIPREWESLPLYVRLADQLDGAWLSSDPEMGGAEGVLRCLREDQGCLRTDLLRNWREVRIFDPHHPFLLDELQRWLSLFSLHITGSPPLIEVHQDGELFMLLPEEGFDETIQHAMDKLCAKLPFDLELNVSNRGMPALYNGCPTHPELAEFIATRLSPKDFSDLFKIQSKFVEQVREPLDELFADMDLKPRWPKKAAGALVSLYATLDDIDEAAREWLHRAAYLVLLLNLKVESKIAGEVLSSDEREAGLLEIIPDSPPDWINQIPDAGSRRTLIALWATVMAERDDEVLSAVWGEEGLLKSWMEGSDDKPGFNRFITGTGSEVQSGVRHRFQRLINGQRIVTGDETAMGRCLFTDEPVPFERSIDQALGLYGVRVSAFSGRDGRPELLTSERSHTNVSMTSIAEHKFRSQVHQREGSGRDEGVPILISSPTTSGLFGGLAMTDDKEMRAMSLYDLNRLEIKKGKVLRGVEMYRARHRMARLERMPEKLKDQVNTMRMLLQAARRIGRPLHVFRGLPIPQRAYFYYDAMPGVLVELLGSNSLRLEQIPQALRHLATAQSLLETPGLGYDALRLYATPATRFGAICLAWCHLRDRETSFTETVQELYRQYLEISEEGKLMSDQDGALVRLGRAAAGIQKNPGGQASASDELLVFKLCMDAVNESRRNGQEDSASLIYAVAGELETNLVRREKAAAREYRGGKTLRDGCIEVAELFVRDVLLGVLKGKSPTQKSRRILSSIYRMAFTETHRKHVQEKKKSE